ncbi:MAG: hypothetical protein ABI680_16270, partial [Chthoniobacteraceae bacterium]
GSARLVGDVDSTGTHDRGGMSHAETILRALDRRLAQPVHLVLYGRAALALGFQPPLPVAEISMDVDVILPLAQSAELETAPHFWSALTAVNRELEPQGLFLTHLFDETQVILRPCWLDHLEPILLPGLVELRLSRPAAIDLLLTKMMRGLDPEDMAESAFLIQAGRVDATVIRAATPPRHSGNTGRFSRCTAAHYAPARKHAMTILRRVATPSPGSIIGSL